MRGFQRMSQSRSRMHARSSPDAAAPRVHRSQSPGSAGRTFSGGPGPALRRIIFLRSPEASHFLRSLAMVPALTAGVSSYALFADARAIQSQLNLLSNIIPPAALDIVRDEITRIAANTDGKLTLSFLGSLALSLWSANSGVKALFEALNVLYGEEEKRSFVQLNAFSMLLTVCSIAAMLIGCDRRGGLAAGVFDHGLPGTKLTIIALLRWPAMLILPWSRLDPLPIWTKPSVGAGPLDYARQFDGGFPLARDVCDIFLVSQPCRELHRNIRRTRRSHWLDDVDVAFRRHCPSWSEAQRRNRASDRSRHDHRAAKAARKPRRCHGRYGRQGSRVSHYAGWISRCCAPRASRKPNNVAAPSTLSMVARLPLRTRSDPRATASSVVPRARDPI